MEYDYYFTWTKQIISPKLKVKSTKGNYFILSGGEKVFDAISTNFQAILGHSNKKITKSIQTQLNQMPIASPKAIFDLKNESTKLLIKFLKLKEGKIFYTISGSESVENALKLARQISGKKYILARKKSYHGATLGALSATGDWRNEKHFSLSNYTIRIPEPEEDPSLEKTKKIIKNIGATKLACIILETITALNGVIVPQKKWWNGIQKLAKDNNILLIIDEVTTGFYRTGTNFAFHKYKLKPDIVCMAKGITAGYIPFGAVWTSKKIARYYDKNILSCGLTNYAHPLGLAAMNSVIKQLNNKNFKTSFKVLQDYFYNNLEKIKKLPNVKSIRSSGLLSAIELNNVKNINWQKAINYGLHLAVNNNLIILAPPFVVTKNDLKQMFLNLKKLILD
ncbi:MAG: aminotransferase class III-fold pyridoxal phosphate-dependent enzyme [Bacteroidetes bacterium]|nr:aminotransferase class III-fold pyridoxal phosphate-dependent enzyme [Bacteroidota bacterium]